MTFMGFALALFLIFSMWFFLLVYFEGCVDDDKQKRKYIIGAILTIVIIGAFLGYYNLTASGARALKSQHSNFNHGMHRRVEVYDMNGNLIKSYEGKFDVDYDAKRIIFDDENNLRHIIYYPTGTVIIDEIEGGDKE